MLPSARSQPTQVFGGAVRRISEDGRVRVTEELDAIRITEDRPVFIIPETPLITSLTDIRTTWDLHRLQGDWVFVPPDLVTGRDLETAAIISLFTDRLAHDDDRLPDPNDGDRRGWWADWDAEPAGYIGSRLWLLSREKQTEEVRQRAEEYCREALQWMLDDDVADSIEITAQWAGLAPGRLEVGIIVSRARAVLLQRHYSWAWGQFIDNEAPRRFEGGG